LVGFARDGHPIFIFDSTIDSLDECDADSDATRGYHCHLAAPGTNRLIGCYRGIPEQGASQSPQDQGSHESALEANHNH
jgi:hypothetical protein